MNHLQALITAIEDFRLYRVSPIHVHSTTPRPLMALHQCVVCHALKEAEGYKPW